MKEKYILIPESVKLNKKIPPGAKLLFGDILSLSKGKGYCFASNKRDGKSVRKVYTKNCVGVHKKLSSTDTKNCGHNNINKIKTKTKVVI